MDTLNKFLDAVFSSRILEARKYFPTVTLSLRANTTVHLFVPELVNRLIKNGAFLTSDQFEVLVRVMNIVLMNEKMAVQILPLTTVIYQVCVCALMYLSAPCIYTICFKLLWIHTGCIHIYIYIILYVYVCVYLCVCVSMTASLCVLVSISGYIHYIYMYIHLYISHCPSGGTTWCQSIHIYMPTNSSVME